MLKPEVLGKIYPSTTLSIENPKRNDWASKPGLRCEKLATERVSSSMANISRVKENKVRFC